MTKLWTVIMRFSAYVGYTWEAHWRFHKAFWLETWFIAVVTLKTFHNSARKKLHPHVKEDSVMFRIIDAFGYYYKSTKYAQCSDSRGCDLHISPNRRRYILCLPVVGLGFLNSVVDFILVSNAHHDAFVRKYLQPSHMEASCCQALSYIIIKKANWHLSWSLKFCECVCRSPFSVPKRIALEIWYSPIRDMCPV